MKTFSVRQWCDGVDDDMMIVNCVSGGVGIALLALPFMSIVSLHPDRDSLEYICYAHFLHGQWHENPLLLMTVINPMMAHALAPLWSLQLVTDNKNMPPSSSISDLFSCRKEHFSCIVAGGWRCQWTIIILLHHPSQKSFHSSIPSSPPLEIMHNWDHSFDHPHHTTFYIFTKSINRHK